MQDVIAGRIEKAKKLLKTSNLTINEIASKCGYKTEYHFMRQFKEQTACTPTQYRNGNTWLQIDEFRKKLEEGTKD
ncbi:MAG: AraC family transcriptional regulator [Treponema sp.]|nr:AraC family transcriptional regulator [Treponema sp.]